MEPPRRKVARPCFVDSGGDLGKLADLVDQHVTAVEKRFRGAGIRLCQLQIDVQKTISQGVQIIKRLVGLGQQSVFQRRDGMRQTVESIRHRAATLHCHDPRPHLGGNIADVVKAGKEILQRRADIALARHKNVLKLLQGGEIG